MFNLCVMRITDVVYNLHVFISRFRQPVLDTVDIVKVYLLLRILLLLFH